MTSADLKEYRNWINQPVANNLHDGKRWPRIGIVKDIGFNTANAVCASVILDKNENFLIKWIKKKFTGYYSTNKTVIFQISKLKLLEDERRNYAEAASSSELRKLNTHTDSKIMLFDQWLYIPLPSEQLQLNDAVVWLGGETMDPKSGIVKWIGVVKPETENCREEAIPLPLRAWVEFDDAKSFQDNDTSISVNFNCKKHGYLVFVEELMSTLDYYGFMEDNKSSLDIGLVNYEDFRKYGNTNQDFMTFDEPAAEALAQQDKATCSYSQRNSSDSSNFFGSSESWNQDKSGKYPGRVHKYSNEDQHTKHRSSKDFSDIHPTDFQQKIPVGSTVVKLDEFERLFGTVKWIGTLYQYRREVLFAGIEFERELKYSFNSTPLPFACEPNHGALISVNEILYGSHYEVFKQSECTEEDEIPDFHFLAEHEAEMPLSSPVDYDKFQYARKTKGIQGDNNSCYIDSTLFSLFAFTDIFDDMLKSPKRNYSTKTSSDDISIGEKVRQIIRHSVVNPLREDYFVPYKNVAQLRRVLKTMNTKLESSFMDAEEFMFILFEKVFNLPEFIHYDSGSGDFIHSIALGTSSKSAPICATVRSLLKTSLRISGVKFNKIPSPGLILQMPLSSGKLMQGKYIIPNLSLKISDLSVNGREGVNATLDLMAVICINRNHFVSFVKCQVGEYSPWVFFDSDPMEGNPKVEIVEQMDNT